MNLIVGRLAPKLEESTIAACHQRGLIFPREWHFCPENMVSIDIFNLATLDVFHQHVFRLDDLPNVEESIARTRFRNLPFYVLNVWLPLKFQPIPQPEITDGNGPVPLLSCQGLIRDLEEIKRSSDIALGDKPEGYDLMRKDSLEFYRSKITLKDNCTMVQWIWRGLYDAAQLAIGNYAPLLAAE